MKYFTLLALLLLAPFALSAQSTELQADLQLLNELFAGEFNNYQQVHQEREDSLAEELIHEHIHSIFRPVSLDWLGHSVYFVKQYMDNNPANVYRQRIYNFHLNEEEQAIQLDIYSFADKDIEKTYGNAHLDARVLENLTSDQLKASPGCEVFWQRTDDHFIGYMKENACNFISRRSNKRIFITDSLMLNQEEIWIRDEAADEDGNYVFGHPEKIPHKLKRCAFYTGWAAAKPAEATEMSAIRELRFHNQGDKQQIRFTDGQPTGYSVRLGQLLYGNKLEVLQLAIFADGSDKPLTYTWASAESERIGVNIQGVFQVGLTGE